MRYASRWKNWPVHPKAKLSQRKAKPALRKRYYR